MTTLALILLVPYFAWGIYALRLKYQYHEELSLVVEAGTLLGLMAFYYVEFILLREALENNKVQFMVAVLGLVTSGAALYGHMAVSFSARLIVGAVVAGPDERDDRPRLGPAEALERQRDFEGALQEYYVIARTFPKDHTVHMRIAQLHVQLGRPEESLQWFHRAEKWATTEAAAFAVANRLSDVYARALKRHDDARATLSDFLDRFPGYRDAEGLRARIAGIGAEVAAPDTAALSAMSDAPLEDSAPEDTGPTLAQTSASTLGVTALDDAPVMAERIDLHVVEEIQGEAIEFGLEKLDDAAPLTTEDDLRPSDGPGIGLELIEDAPAKKKKKS